MGFLQTEVALTQLDHVHREIEGRSQVDIIYMDFQKAFDSVHLLIKLWALGKTGDLWMWFLIDRSQVFLSMA